MKTHVRKFMAVFAGILAALLFSGSLVAADSPYQSGSTGIDVSYPNCSMSLPYASFGIVGVNNGITYSTNPCMLAEASQFVNLSLYVNTAWNSGSSYINASSPRLCATGDQNCLAYNYGYNAGLYAYNAATNLGVRSPTWWLDVETSATWNSDVVQNQNSIQGMYDALSDKGATTLGIYSTTAQWKTITGGWQNLWPSWGATTWNTAKQASTYCSGHQFTGGPSLLMQFINKRSRIDQDVAC